MKRGFSLCSLSEPCCIMSGNTVDVLALFFSPVVFYVENFLEAETRSMDPLGGLIRSPSVKTLEFGLCWLYIPVLIEVDDVILITT